MIPMQIYNSSKCDKIPDRLFELIITVKDQRKFQQKLMKEKYQSFGNMSSFLDQKKQIGSQMHSFNGPSPTNKFTFNLQTFRKFNKNSHPDNLQILDCFNNLSSVMEEKLEHQNHDIMKCKKVFKREDDESQLPKFSSIESEQTSMDNSIFQDQIIPIQQKSRYQRDQNYSFNEDQTQRCLKFEKKTNGNKSKYQNLIQKIDSFLVKDFNDSNVEISIRHNIEKQQNEKMHINLKPPKNNQKFQKHYRQKSESFVKTQEHQLFVRENKQFISSYEALEKQNFALKNQLMNQVQITKKVQILEKQIFQKNIVIEFLTKQLERKEKRESCEKQYKENKLSSQKQRNTVSPASIFPKAQNCPPKYRASHHVQSRNDNLTSFRPQAYQRKKQSEDVQRDSFFSNNKSNSFMKKIFRKSNEVSNERQNSKGQLYNNQSQNFQDTYLVEILKEENSILMTKLNILYGDFQQILDKYNQVLTQKNICKAKCCKTLNGNIGIEYLESGNEYRYTRECLLLKDEVQLLKNEDFNRIRKILQKLSPNQVFPQNFNNKNESFMNQLLIPGKESQKQTQQLFSEEDLLRMKLIEKKNDCKKPTRMIPQPFLNSCLTDRTVLLNRPSQKRFSMEQKYFSCQENQKRFSTFIGHNTHLNFNRPEQIQNQNTDLKMTYREKIAPRQSFREALKTRVNGCFPIK